MPYVYDPINCIGYNVSTKDNLTTDEAEWGVYKTGGSAGEKTNYFVIEGLTEEEARKRAKSRMQGLSAGEKQYYKIRYVAKKVHDAKTKDEESYFESMRPKKYKIFGDIVLLKSLTGSTATYTTSNGQTVRIGRRKWDELARKINKEENK